MKRTAQFLGKVRDFRGHDAAAFWIAASPPPDASDAGVVYLDLTLAKSTRKDELVPAPRVGKLASKLTPGTVGTVSFFTVKQERIGATSRTAGTFLDFSSAAKQPADMTHDLDLEASAILAVRSTASAAVNAFEDRIAKATGPECVQAINALLLTRGRVLAEKLFAKPPACVDQNAAVTWQLQALVHGTSALATYAGTDADLVLLATAARLWAKKASASAATDALRAAVGTQFFGAHLGPRPAPYRNMESYVEARVGPFDRDDVAWWDLMAELDSSFAKQVMTKLAEYAGEGGLWIDSVDAKAKRVTASGEGAWTLEPSIQLPAGLAFGSQVSVVSKQASSPRRVLAIKIEKTDPTALATQLVKGGDAAAIGLLAKRRAAGESGLPKDWPKLVDSLASFSQLDAIAQTHDVAFLDELEQLLPRTLKEAEYRMDTQSIRQPIAVALGWILAGKFDRARKLLDKTPALIKTYGVPYDTKKGTLSSYQEYLITATRWIADRRESPNKTLPAFPEFGGSELKEWVKQLDPAIVAQLK